MVQEAAPKAPTVTTADTTTTDTTAAHYRSLARQAKLLREAAAKLRDNDGELAAACIFAASLVDGMVEPRHGWR